MFYSTQRVNSITSRVFALPPMLSHHTLGSAERPLIDGTFGSTIAANLLESFTGQGLCSGKEGALATGKIKPSTNVGRSWWNIVWCRDRCVYSLRVVVELGKGLLNAPLSIYVHGCPMYKSSMQQPLCTPLFYLIQVNRLFPMTWHIMNSKLSFKSYLVGQENIWGNMARINGAYNGSPAMA